MTIDSVATRIRHHDDLGECAELLKTVHATDGYPVEGVSNPIVWLTPSRLLKAWVAEVDDKIVGHVSVCDPETSDAAPWLWDKITKHPHPDPAVLNRLFVSPEARGRSIARVLIQEASDYADIMNLQLVLDVMQKDKAAVRLYERLGWQRIGETQHESGHGLVPAYCYARPRRTQPFPNRR